jgi:hypothetical protein
MADLSWNKRKSSKHEEESSVNDGDSTDKFLFKVIKSLFFGNRTLVRIPDSTKKIKMLHR